MGAGCWGNMDNSGQGKYIHLYTSVIFPSIVRKSGWCRNVRFYCSFEIPCDLIEEFQSREAEAVHPVRTIGCRLAG